MVSFDTREATNTEIMARVPHRMDRVQKTFDRWALNGRSELMEREHARSVLAFLRSVRFRPRFSFLDAGCGNGWVVRHVAAMPDCRTAVGIDASQNMIRNAKSKSRSRKESFVRTDLEGWRRAGRFDYVFSMESIYYSESVQDAVDKVYGLLKPGGEFFCGTDFYKENRATARWAGMMDVPMHLLSRSQWRRIFARAGFEVRTRQIKDPASRKKWRRDLGTLFVTGRR